MHDNIIILLYDCHSADEGTMDIAQHQNLKEFFMTLSQKQCERAKARLIDALTRIEEVMQEAEVMSFFCIGFEDISVNFMPLFVCQFSERTFVRKVGATKESQSCCNDNDEGFH